MITPILYEAIVAERKLVAPFNERMKDSIVNWVTRETGETGIIKIMPLKIGTFISNKTILKIVFQSIKA